MNHDRSGLDAGHYRIMIPASRPKPVVFYFAWGCSSQNGAGKKLGGERRRERAQSSSVIPGRRVSGEPGIQAASMAVLPFWIPGSR
jgi:hypothetical protein